MQPGEGGFISGAWLLPNGVRAAVQNAIGKIGVHVPRKPHFFLVTLQVINQHLLPKCIEILMVEVSSIEQKVPDFWLLQQHVRVIKLTDSSR